MNITNAIGHIIFIAKMRHKLTLKFLIWLLIEQPRIKETMKRQCRYYATRQILAKFLGVQLHIFKADVECED